MTLAPTLMVQGTGSSVGKSVLVTGLCRLFAEDGWRVAPFKAQNMSNNAVVTADGGEIGVAQAAQAAAAGIPATVDMNPILLKPEGPAVSQVVVRGQAIGRMGAREYHQWRGRLWPVVRRSLRDLRHQHDLVVIEGAGSPAEVNLRATDLVNMRVARAAGAAVLLVADIDRGGALAALVGTLALLTPTDRRRVRGLVINRFRGDRTLLDPGLDFLERRTRRPVVGVIPWLDGLAVPPEDSMELGRPGSRPPRPAAAGATLDVVIVRLPRVANFDEFLALEREPGVRVRWVDRAADLGDPDLCILPGSKTTLADLAALHAGGLAPALRAAVSRGTACLGICGGYQMLGEAVADPAGLEGPTGSAPGLGLLPVRTVLGARKVVRRVGVRVRPAAGLLAAAVGAELSGYEIHRGRTRWTGRGGAALAPFTVAGRAEGASAAGGWVVGSHLHGLLHDQTLRRALLGAVARRRGRTWVPGAPLDLDGAGQVAAALREHLDLTRLRSWIGEVPCSPR